MVVLFMASRSGWVMTVLLVVLIMFLGFSGIMIYKFGWGTTGYIAKQIVQGKTGVFEKEKLPSDVSTMEERYRVPGLLLFTKDNDIWLLTIYGVQHFTPIDAKNIFILGNNICQYQDAIKNNLAKSGSNTFSMQNLTYKNIQDWLHDNKVGKRKYIQISYLVADDKKSIKKYRYVYSSDALFKVHTGEDMCP